MFSKAFTILCLASLLLKGEALPQNSSTLSVSTGNSSCTSGQVTNVIVQGGVAGERGERGPPGPQGLTGPAGPPGGGVVYTHWGRTTCPNTQGTERVYEGIMAGSRWDKAGSSEYLCLHDTPQHLQVTPGVQESHRASLYGTEYEARASPPAFGSMRNHNAPCAVCYSSGRTATITIPGRTSCPSSWTREYYGYLMTENENHPRSGRAPICVDVNPESVPGSSPRTENSQLYFVEIRCAGLCPPYTDGHEVACVVCTK